MNNYFDLIKNDVIDFNKLLLEKYSQLGLDEVDYIILIKLHYLLRSGVNSLNVSNLITTMTISKEKGSKRIVNLVNNGYLSLEMSTTNSKEIFSLDELYTKLAYLLEGKSTQKEEAIKRDIKLVVKMLEQEFKKILSPIEMQIITKWFYDYNYTTEEIEEALIDAKRTSKAGIQYMDRFLYKKSCVVVPEKSDDLVDLFKKVYAKK